MSSAPQRKSAAATQDATTSNQNLYDQLYSAIQQSYLSDFLQNGQLAPQWQFQFPNPAAQSPAVWVNTVNNDFQTYQMFEAGDLAPISKQGSYVTSSASPSIFQYYGSWLGAVVPTNVNTIPAYVTAQRQATQDTQNMASAVTGAGPAFTTWSAQNPDSQLTTVTQWLTTTPAIAAAQPFATNYQNALADYDAQMAIMAQIVQTADGPLSTALTNYANTSFRTVYATQNEGNVTMGTTIVGNLDGSLNPVADWVAWSSGQSNPDLTPFTAPVATGVVPVSTVEEITLTVTERFSFFFGLISLTMTEQMTFFESITTDENFSLDMNWASLVMYPISRTGWYSETFLGENANDQLSAGNSIDFFGPDNGVLYLVPSFVFLGWNPSLTLTLSTPLYQQWQSQLQASEGVWLNGIEVAGPPASTTNNPDGTTTLKYGDPTSTASMQQLPAIVGYVHFVPTTQGTD